jgi:hypothetical protein
MPTLPGRGVDGTGLAAKQYKVAGHASVIDAT